MNRLSLLPAGRSRTVLRGLLILLVAAFWGAYLWRNWQGFLAYRWQLDLIWLLPALFLAVIYWALLVLIWHQTLLASGGSLGLGKAARLWTTSMLARYVPGGVWHIAGRVYLAAEAGESRTATFVSTVVEQILALLSTLLALLVSLPFWDPDYGRLSPVLVLVLPLAAAVHPSVLRRLTTLATRFAKRKSASGGSAQDGVVPDGPLPAPGYTALLVFLLAYTLGIFFVAASLYFAAAAVGPVSVSQLPAFLGAYAVGWFVGYFSFFAPSGLGVREGAVVLILTPFVGAPAAVAASILNRLAISLSEVLVFGGAWAIGVRDRRQGSGDIRQKSRDRVEGGADSVEGRG